MGQYTVDIQETYPPLDENDEPTVIGELATNEEYLTYVMNMAGQSYKMQHQTATVEDGITAAREARNAEIQMSARAAAEEQAEEE